jgi:hypothetical protein
VAGNSVRRVAAFQTPITDRLPKKTAALVIVGANLLLWSVIFAVILKFV